MYGLSVRDRCRASSSVLMLSSWSVVDALPVPLPAAFTFSLDSEEVLLPSFFSKKITPLKVS